MGSGSWRGEDGERGVSSGCMYVVDSMNSGRMCIMDSVGSS